MGRMKEFYHDDIEEQMRRDLIEEPNFGHKNEYNYVFSISASRLSEVHTLMMLAYQDIKSGAEEGSETIKTPQGETINFGFRKL